MKKDTPKTKTINVDLSPDVHRLLKIAAAARGLTLSQCVNEAVAMWAPKQIAKVAS